MGTGRKSSRHVTNGLAFRSTAVAGSYLARLMPCDGCHRISFQKVWLYTLPTTGEFNMCNCTPRQGRPEEPPPRPHPPFTGPGCATPHRDESVRTSPVRSRPDARFPVAQDGQADAREAMGIDAGRAHKRSRWTRRSPARSHDDTRMAQVWRPLGRAPVIWSYGWAMRVGGPKSPVVTRRQGYVRPRCAAAEYPQAVRGPLPRGTGDVHRACGWT